MHKNTVRVSFDVPVNEHIIYKTECVKSRVPIKDFLHNLVIIGMKEYRKAQLHQQLTESFQQVKEGKYREVTKEYLDKLEKEIDGLAE